MPGGPIRSVPMRFFAGRRGDGSKGISPGLPTRLLTAGTIAKLRELRNLAYQCRFLAREGSWCNLRLDAVAVSL
jgi:hypothetical protein